MNSHNLQPTFLGSDFTLPEPRCDDGAPGDIPIEYGLPPDPSFIDSVRRFGVIEPVVVLTCAGTTVLVSGRRRVRAARLAGLDRIPRLTCALDSEHAPRLGLIVASLTVMLNEQRRENPLADFAQIRALRAKGATDRDITAVTGMPAGRIRRREKLGRLIPALFEALERERLSIGLAERVAALPAPQQAALAAKLAAEGRLTHRDLADVREARAQVHVLDLLNTEMADLLTAPAPATLADVARALSPDTARRAAAELPNDPRFDAVRAALLSRASEVDAALLFAPARTAITAA